MRMAGCTSGIIGITLRISECFLDVPRFIMIIFARVIASLSLGAPRTFIMTRDHKVKPPSNSSHLTVTSSCDVPHTKPSPSSNGKPKATRKRKSGQALEENEGSDEARRKNQDDDESGSHVSDSRTAVEPVDKKTWILDPGSLVVMQGETQRYWKHQIPKYVSDSVSLSPLFDFFCILCNGICLIVCIP